MQLRLTASGSLLWVTLACLSCATPTQTSPQPAAIEEPVFYDDGSRLFFEPGFFDWQPEGVTIVLHPLRRYHPSTHPNEGKCTVANNRPGLRFGIRHRQKTWEEKSSIWIGVKLDELAPEPMLYMFEVWRHGSNAYGSYRSFYWQLDEHICVGTSMYSDALVVWIESWQVLQRDRESDTVAWLPTTYDPWERFERRIREKEQRAIDLIVYRPELDEHEEVEGLIQPPRPRRQLFRSR